MRDPGVRHPDVSQPSHPSHLFWLKIFAIFAIFTAFALFGPTAEAQRSEEGRPPPPGQPAQPGGPGGPGGPFGPGRGGFGGVRPRTQLVEQFDTDGDKRLNTVERKAAREFLEKERAAGRGPGGPGRGGFGRGFGPAMVVAPAILSQADEDSDHKVSREELARLAAAWFDKLDPDKAGKLNQEEFAERIGVVLPEPQRPEPQGFGGGGGGRGRGAGGRGFDPARTVGPGLFTAADGDRDGSLTRSELEETFRKWFSEWDSEGSGSLDEAKIRRGLDAVLPQPNFGRGRGRGFPGRGENAEPPQPGPTVSPSDVESFPGAPLYDTGKLRTLFLEFENADWEKELAEFKGTDVEVPTKLTVDGQTYEDVGVHFRGASSFMMVGEGRKRSLNLSLDFVQKGQRLGGYRTVNILNSHGDPTFLRAVLYNQIAREYLPAPKANFVRLVINSECWGVYVNAQQFNTDFLKDWFGTTKGARFKAPGSPGGRAGLTYLGDDVEQYKRIYEIRSKDNPDDWAALIGLCKVLSETPSERLEEALAPLLDIDGALRFLAIENTLVNNDGYWIRASDYNLYRDEKGCFHIIPHDTNETFLMPGGPGFGGRGGFGGPGRGIAGQAILRQGDKDSDGKLAKEELVALADVWFEKLDGEKTGKLSREAFTADPDLLLAPPEAPRGRGTRGGPDAFVFQGIFEAADSDRDGSLTVAELKDLLGKWFGEWDEEKSGSLDEEALSRGLRGALPRPAFGPPGGPGGPDGGGRGPAGPGGGGRGSGVELDPLIALSDSDKPLLSKLLSVPALKERYLRYVRDIAEKWLDWERLGPIAKRYQELIAESVKADTRKLDSTEDFVRGLAEEIEGGGGFGGGARISLKRFADQRRAYLLNHEEVKKAVARAE